MAKILMISLDKKILDPNSAVAQRMIGYGRGSELYILIPNNEDARVDLSPSVHAQGVGGNKISHFFRLRSIGQRLIKENGLAEITAQDPFFTGLIGWLLKKGTGAKLEVQLHGDFLGDYYRHSGLINRCKYYLGIFIMKRADRLRAVGERIRQSLLETGFENDKITVRPVSIDAEKIKNYIPKINLRERYPGHEKIFLCLGRLDPVKNIAWLIDVFAEVVKSKPRFLLLIVGQGPEEKNLKSKITKLKLERNVLLAGWSDEPLDYLKTADCLLFPSLSEGYGLAAMEASIAGAPVIMTDVGVANYELKSDSKIRILSVNGRGKWINAFLDA